MSPAPEIRTARLRLRAPRAADFEAVAAFLCSERAAFVAGWPYDRAAAWANFASSAESWALLGFGYWSVEEAATGRLVGQVGLSRPPEFPETELGWELHDGFEGLGYATEAAAAARDWAFGPGGHGTLVSYVRWANARSIRVAERLGALPDPAAARPHPEDLVWRHPMRGRAAA